MMAYVLIVYVSVFGPAGPVLGMQEFNSLETCESAGKEFQALAKGGYEYVLPIYTCVRK